MKPEFRSSRDVIVRTRNLEQAQKFYSTVLGFIVEEHSDTLKGFETGAFYLYLEKGKDHGPVFDFLVADVQAAKAKLIAAGCTLIEEDASVPRCYVRDPYGIVFNIGLQSSGK